MKKLLFAICLLCISSITKAQMISITGGNLNLHGKDKGYVEVEVMEHLTKKISAHVSLTKTIGGYDIAMVGGRYALLKQRVGLMLSACYMDKHATMAMWGIDLRPLKKSPLSIVYSQSTDNELKTLGIKIPVINIHRSKKH